MNATKLGKHFYCNKFIVVAEQKLVKEWAGSEILPKHQVVNI